ncbi:hypothetical protein QLQ12_11895 [Actinoplanes sp. NEAU-A12]|uniref:MFS transporter n=1 Tax=Actinoplanes sandaracinus TaxID=3045177 RepID=A0ABT6WHV2_9ACTN|nr:hypothetical protein [Actinoplanes sandaracinus]MDI6099295.1 hypothetical protein [Actinoplanes sandaracinus]
MVEERARSARRKALLGRLGGPPGPYAAVCVVLAVMVFPFRLLLDRGDPITESIAGSGLQGAMFALMSLAFTWAQRMTAAAPGSTGNPPPLTAADRSVRDRRGAIVGLGIGVPFFGGLIALCLSTGLPHAYAISFGVVLAVMAMIAIRNLHRRPPVSAS